MGTNGTIIAAEPGFEHEILSIQADHEPSPRRRAPDAETVDDFALAPLVDKIALGIARGLVAAMKELENHIAVETRKVGDTVERRLSTLQTSLTELSDFVKEQRSNNQAVQDQLQQLTAADAGLTAGLDTLRAEAREFSSFVEQQIDSAAASVSQRIDGVCRDMSVQQEDVAAIKVTFPSFSSRIDALVERLDRQADAVRLLHTTYSQRETELEQLVDGLARLRAFPKPLPMNGL